ncbi:MAG: serine/threonine-protein kinase [Myxococcota bacterium]
MPVGLEDLRGQVFEDAYAIDELVSMGPRQVVFAGKEVKTDRSIVLRLLRPIVPNDPTIVKRFEQRISASAELSHPVVGCPKDWGQLVDGVFYIVSDRPPGETLEQHLASVPKGRLDWKEARPLLLDLVRGLAAIHDRQLVHGNISPASCWIREVESASPSLRLLDLGSNLDPGRGDDLGISGTTTIGGDAIFSAPETADGYLGDERTDVYLLGLLAYTMLTGRPPFFGANPFQVAAMHLTEPVPPMREAKIEVPAAVEAMVLELLAKQPKQRPESMTEVEEAIRAIGADEPLGAMPPRMEISPSSSMLSGSIEMRREHGGSGAAPAAEEKPGGEPKPVSAESVDLTDSSIDAPTSTTAPDRTAASVSRDELGGDTLESGSGDFTWEPSDEGSSEDYMSTPSLDDLTGSGHHSISSHSVETNISHLSLPRLKASSRSRISRLRIWVLVVTVSAAVAGISVGLILR